jgi:hypothetical protein
MASSPSSGATTVTCLRIVRRRGVLRVRRLGRVRLRTALDGCIRRRAPLRVSFRKRRGTRVRSVRYRLDGKRLRRARRPAYAVRLGPAKLRPGRHVLTVRVKPRDGRARAIKLRLRLAVR